MDFEQISIRTSDELQALRHRWFSLLPQPDKADPKIRFKTGLLKLSYNYARLVALSCGFQYAFSKNEGKIEEQFLEQVRYIYLRLFNTS